MKRKKGVLSLWAMLLIVLGVFVGVIGLVALIMFLSGQFNEKIIEPQDLIISLYEGSEGFDDGEGHFYVANDFKLVINTTTEGVTAKEVKLKFNGDYITRNGYITDMDEGVSVMTMPEIVEIGKPFTVSLARQYNASVDANVVVGGIKSLTAESVANVELEHLSFTIAVDVPVSDIDVGIEQGSSTVFDNLQTVTIGSVFDFRVNFKPEQSKYVFSDNQQQKEYFYDFSTSNIRRNWETGHFVAYAKNGSVDDVTVYTFANSYYRQLALNEIAESFTDNPNLKDEDPEQYNIAMLNYFDRNPAGAIKKTFQVQVVDVTVNENSVQLKNGDSNEAVQLDPVYVDKYFTLTANSENGDDTLGITVRDTGGEEKSYLVANIGIKMPEVDGLIIEGDKVMQVTNATGEIEESQFDLAKAKHGDYKSTEEYSYYILPNTTPKENGDYFWRFNATKALSTQTFAINFFYENEAGKLVSLYEFGAENEKSATLTITEQDVETPPYWKETSDIKMNITYDSEGNAKTAVVELNEYLAPLTSTNIYDVVRFFMMFPNQNNEDISRIFPYKSRHTYTNNYKDELLMIQGYDNDGGGYELYELETSTLYALRSFSSTALVLAATIRTDADHNPYLTSDAGNGGYMYEIVNISTPKAVIVESALSIVNMKPSFTFVEERNIGPDEKDGKYYVPAISRSASGSSLDMISFELKIENVEDITATSNKVEEAFRNKNLTIECLNGQNEPYDVDYLQLETLASSGVAGTEPTFTGRIVINETAFTAEHINNYTNLDTGKPIKLRLVYDNGIEKQYKEMTLKDDANVSSFYVYYPQPYFDVEGMDGKYYIEGEYKNYNLGSATEKTECEITVDIDENVEIRWDGTDVSTFQGQLGTSDDAIEILNTLLTFTLKDQHGREIAEGLYNIRLVEEDEEGNAVNTGAIGRSQLLNQIVNLSPTPDGESTYLRAYVVENAITENEDNYFVRAYDESFASTGDRLGSLRFKFTITGKGIDHIEYDDTETIAAETAASWKRSSDNGTVTVKKVISRANETSPSVDLAKLVRIYKTDEVDPIPDADLTFKLDEEWLAMLSSKEDLSEMLRFNDELKLEQAENENITSIKFLNVFRSDTDLKFIITDSSKLFKISFVFVCMADVTIGDNFRNFSENERYSPYLVSNPNSSREIPIFANHDYKLDEFTVFNSANDYTWEKGFNGKTDLSELYTSSKSDVATIIKKGEDIYLHVEEVYTFTSVTITVYYYINSSYSPMLYLNLYINPNIIVQETLQQGTNGAILDLAQFEEAFPTFEDNFKFYLAFGQDDNNKGYIDNSESFVGLTPVDVTGLRFDFSGNNQYIAINEIGTGEERSGKYKYNLNAGTLDLSFGQQVAQSFIVRTTNSDFNAIRIVTTGGKDVVYKSQEPLALTLYITYAADASKIFAQNVETVLYGQDKQLYVIMTTSGSGGPAQYTPASGSSITFTNASGGAIKCTDGQNIQVFSTDIQNFVKYDNSIVAVKPLMDGETTLKINLKINIIASMIGDKFLYYDGQFNHFKDVPFSVLMSSSAELARNNVYQDLEAGKDTYKIVHDTRVVDEKDKEGFYFYGNDGYSVTLDIVDDQHGIASLKKSVESLTYNDTLALGNLEDTLKDVYVTLRLTIRQGRNSISYYYRIKVIPNFKIGIKTYPFDVDDGEYLDTSSRYYNETDKVYKIDLEEQFDETNSYAKYNAKINANGKRFTDPDFGSSVDLTSTYKIGNLYDESVSSQNPLGGNISQYLTSQIKDADGETPTFFDGTTLNIGLVDESRQLTVEIIKSFQKDGVALVGGDLVYKLRFNQGRQYSYQITAPTGDGMPSVTPQRENVNTYRTTLTASEDKEAAVTFNIKLAERNGQAETDITDYEFYTAILGDATSVSLPNIEVDKTGKTVSIETPESITKDFDVEIGFYTSQKRVFRFVVTFTSSLKISPNTEFVGGKIYNFSGAADAIFTDTGYTITGKEGDINAKYYKIDKDGGTIEFAHLTEDRDFAFTAEKNGYSFDFTITVQKSIDKDNVRTYVDKDKHYGQIPFDVNLIDVLKYAGLLDEDEEDTREFTLENGHIEPSDVAVDGEIFTLPFTIKYKFDKEDEDSCSFDFAFNYQYTVDKNVAITVNYPKPDGQHESAHEYLSSEDGLGQFTTKTDDRTTTSTTTTLKDFFIGMADFSTEQRVSVQNDISGQAVKAYWTINIISLENLEILYETKSVGVGNDIITHKELDDATGNLQFRLLNKGVSGSAEFSIEINKVPITYLLTVVSGENISIQRNMPQSEGGAEIIYAENMQNMGVDIFENNRILKYQFSSAAFGTYYVKLENEDNETKMVQIEVDALKNVVNMDLGDTRTGFEYAGTYKSAEGVGNAEDDATIYTLVPALTSRIVAIYADGTTIKSEDVVFKVGKEPETQAGEEDEPEKTAEIDYVGIDVFTLEKEDLDKEVSVSIKLNDVVSSVKYVYRLTLDFEVVNNSDTIDEKGVGATPVTINAGESGSLLDNYQNFVIRHKSGNKAPYTSATMKESVGRMQLRLYGLEEMPIVEDSNDPLTQSALKYHNYLLTHKNENGAINTTGLIPIAKATLNDGIASSGNGYTYVTRVGASGSDSVSSEYDFTIIANGAGNDGNFVMMRLSYIVEFGGLTLTTNHNILFKVMPNSSILYKENKDSSEILGTNDVVDETGHSIWTNKEHPYRVENTENQTPDNVVLWKKDDVSGSAIQAQMYNNRNLSAMNFKYTYDKSVGGGFNEWVDMNDSFAEGKANDNTAWSKMGTGNTSTADQTSVGNNNALEIKVPYLSFGTTKFYVEFENDYGFMARFYFQKSSKLNPTVSSVGANNTLTEGEKYIFAANWKQVEGAKNPTYTFTYEEEAEKGNKLTISVDKKETQKVDGKDDPQEKTYTISAHITITLGNEAKSYTNLAQKNDPGAPGKEEFTDPKSTIGPSSVLTGDVADATQEQGIKFDDDSVTWTLAGFDSKFTWSHLWYWDATGEGSAKNIPAQNMLKGATISVRFDIKVTAGEVDYTNNMVDRLDPITVKFNDKQLNQTYSEGSSGTIETDVEDTEIVRMNGIDAYGFSRRNLTIDEYSATGGNGNQDFTSNFNDILIDRVDFYETDGKTWLGSSILGNTATNGTKEYNVELKDQDYTNEVSKLSGDLGRLYTNDEYEFITGKTEVPTYTREVGRKFESTGSNYFVVPYINGIEFGENESINVIMRVTIRGGKSDTNAQTRTTDFTVQLNRADFAESANAQINDGETVKTKDNGIVAYNFDTAEGKGDATWLNDTLEIDLDPHETVTFAVHNQNKFQTINNVLEVDLKDGDTTSEGYKPDLVVANLITLTNPNDFKITQYVSISGSMVDGAYTSNLDENNPFYIYLVEDKIGDEDGNVVFRYNGSAIDMEDVPTTSPEEQPQAEETSKPKKGSGNIAIYTTEGSIKLRINDVREKTGNSKNVELFFLKKMDAKTMIAGGNRIYRYSKVFEILPRYSEAQHGDLSADGQTLRIEDYYKVADGSGSGFYYVIPMSVWGQKVNLIHSIGEGTTKLSQEDAYKFEFEIEDVRGSASIDKDGNIITAPDFNLTWNQVGVTIREKVAGFDGNFEDGHGTVDLTTTVRGSVNNIIFSFVEAEANENSKQSGAGSYYVTHEKSKTLITLQGSEQLYATSNLEGASVTSVDGASISSNSFAVTPNQSLDLQKMFRENNQFRNLTNVNFYMIGYANGSGQTTMTTTIVRNNIDKFNEGFAEAGTYTIMVVATGIVSGTTKQAQKFTATIYVYNTNNSTNLVEEVEVTEHKVAEQEEVKEIYGTANLITITSQSGTWYEITGGTTTECADGNVKVEEGINRRQFLLGDKVFNITFVGYSGEKGTKDVPIEVATTGNYSISNLVSGTEDVGGNFHRLNGKELSYNVETEYFSYYLQQALSVTYYYQKGDKVTKYNVKYHVIPASVETYNGILKVGTTHVVAKNDIMSLAKQFLNNNVDVKLYTRSQYGVLTELKGDVDLSTLWGSGLARYPFNYVAIWTNNGVENTRQISLDCYLYEDEISISQNIQISISYDLSNGTLLEEIREQAGAQATDLVTFYEITEGVVNESPISQIVLTGHLANEEGYTGEFLIRVGNKYYKLTLTLTWSE